MLWIEILAIFAFLVLLLAGIYLIVNIYTCNNLTCKPFNQAEEEGPRGSKKYAIALLGELFNDGVWPFPYIGAAILTPLSLWLIGVPITVKDFAIVFFISFITIYFLFAFFSHHYAKFITNYVAKYIETNFPNPPSTDETPSKIENPPVEFAIDPFTKELDVTFAPPVITF